MKAPTFKASIYITGSLLDIERVCRRFCLRGLCVTIEPTHFVFTGGSESGATVGLINYPRFPKTREELISTARKLALLLLEECFQRSCILETGDESEWLQNESLPPR